MVGGFFEQVAFASEAGFKRHYHRLANRVYRRIGDLSELLAEIIIQRTMLCRQHRERGVVAHRSYGFLTGFGQYPQNLIFFLERHQELLFVGF